MSQPNNNSNSTPNPYSNDSRNQQPRAPPNAWQQQPPPPPPQQQMYRGPPPQYVPYGMNPYAAYAPQQQQQQRPPSMWQPAPPATYTTQTYYPPPQQQPSAPTKPPPQPKPRKVLTITDKDGNPIDLTGASTKKTTSDATDDAGAKMKQMVLEKLKQDEEKKNATREKEQEAKRKAEEESKRQKEEQEAAEQKKREAEEQKRKQEEEEEQKRKQEEAEQKAKQLEEEKAKQQQEEPKRPSFLAKLQAKKEAAGIAQGSSLSALQAKLEEKQSDAPTTPSTTTSMQPPPLRPNTRMAPIATAAASATGNSTKRRVFTKSELLQFKEMKVCCCRPDDLPDMTVERVAVPDGGGGGGGRRGGNRRESSWQRGAAPPRDSSQRRMSSSTPQEPPKQQWARGVAPPPAPAPQKGGRNNQGPPLYDGPIAPLTKSENRWRPKKDTNALVVAEKQVKAILNKMTKEKFDKLSTQMCEIPILSYDMLTMMIHHVYEKAIDEPTFGDMYADLCAKLSQMTKTGTTFIQIIPSDEEPPTEDGEAAMSTGESSSYKVYRWSNDVSTTDSEIVGPFASIEECTEAALSGKDLEPVQRGDDLELELASLNISNGTFIKTMKKKGEENVFYVVYFPVAEHEECGQQLSKIFLSEIECSSDAHKQNSFKRSLLNKCQDEFDKQDIYLGWKEEKKAYEENKASMTEAEQSEKEAELDFRRMKIKKQMLGNIKFIGQLYKKGLLKEKIMRYCIGSLLKLDVVNDDAKFPEYKDSGDMDLDDEDHEAACSMFTTIGKVIDTPQASSFMNVCFTKMEKLSNDKSLNSRFRFMYKDLIELRDNYWEPRRETEKAKTITEIRKDFEREERRQEQQSRQMGGGGYRGGNRGDRRSDYHDRRDSRGRDYGGGGGSNRSRQPKPQAQVDDDGFSTVIGRGGSRKTAAATPIRIAQRPSSMSKPSPTRKSASKSPPRAASEPTPTMEKEEGPPALSDEKLERRINTIRNEFVQDPNSIDELLLSVDELSGTPDYGTKLVSQNGDWIFEARDAERNAISEMLAILFEKGKLTKSEVQEGLSELVEFIDSFALDAPKAFEYLADVLSALFKVEALDAAWLCEQAEKAKISDPETTAHEKIVQKTMEAMKTKYGVEAVERAFAGTDDSLKLAGLVGADKWNAMTAAIMS